MDSISFTRSFAFSETVYREEMLFRLIRLIDRLCKFFCRNFHRHADRIDFSVDESCFHILIYPPAIFS